MLESRTQARMLDLGLPKVLKETSYPEVQEGKPLEERAVALSYLANNNMRPKE